MLGHSATMRRLVVWVIMIVVIQFATSLPSSRVFAQQEARFEGPTSLTGWLPDSEGPFYPKITADAAGQLHVIWDEKIDPDGPQDVIYYTSWNGESWSYPIDVIVTPTGKRGLESGNLVATSDGLLAVTWDISRGESYVSVAAIGEATDARNWRNAFVGAAGNPYLVIDEKAGMWYLSVDDSHSIYLLVSEDLGRTWRQVSTIFSVFGAGVAIVNHGLYLGPDGSLHSVWAENHEERQWAGTAIGHGWQGTAGEGEFSVRDAIRITDLEGPSVDSPVMAFASNGEAHIVWNNGVGSTVGRYHQWSSDFGRTWSPVRNIYPSLSGQTRQAGLVFDSASRLHLISAAAGPENFDGAIRYAVWQDGQWSPDYQTLWPATAGGEFPSAVMTQGNRLHFVWNGLMKEPNAERERAVFYATTELDAPELMLPGLPVIPPQTNVNSEPALDEQSESAFEVVDQPEGNPSLAFDTAERPVNQGMALGLGVLVSALFIVLAVMVSRRLAGR